MSDKYFTVIATGGTGGHIFPAQAMAEKCIDSNHDVCLICDQRSMPFLDGVFIEVKKQILNVPRSKIKILNILFKYFYLFSNTLLMIVYFVNNRPNQVIAFGGYASFPACLSAVLLKIPLLLHEQNSVLGKINRLFLPFAKNVYTSFYNTKKINEKYKGKVMFIGFPIRKKILSSLKKSKLQQKQKKSLNILVIGGSQGTKLFSDIIPKVIHSLDKKLQEKIHITHQIRDDFIDDANDIYAKTNCSYKISAFFHNMEDLYLSHDLVIARAGASTVVELMIYKKPAILIPLSHSADNHQYDNAKYLKDNCKITLLKEEVFNAKNLKEILDEFLNKPQLLKEAEVSYGDLGDVHINALTKPIGGLVF
ncbi:MAG: UDP-N-acetylglucosamine--N-acetylmuramyl-(pentapeptide) pyrophosphoryl-undecaprenol N-acetylglucosamine transferase [Candidatus Midichloriaceae bacterium]|jgi:UDP-N-acetylglucosamine--N-acetylmuramyl-(pentapeptide) pyrophosphoryl-undecaprenol N-acetylglucosamine transferase